MKTVGIPLVLCFQLDPVSQERLDRWREQYFPKDRNYLKAHLTVFHQLPGQQINVIKPLLAEFAETHMSFDISFDRLMTRQGFVGVGISSEQLQQTRAELSVMFAGVLRAQDKQPYKPHVTVTNLGSPRDAASCFQDLETDFAPWTGQVVGLNLYHYRNGPWEFASCYTFGASNEL